MSHLFRPHRICIAQMRPIATYVVSWSVCVSVSLYVTGTNPAKRAEPIEMPCGMWARVGSRNHVFEGGLDTPGEGTILGWETGRPIVRYREHDPSAAGKRSDLIEVAFCVWICASARRGLSHENYFRFGFEATMRPFIKLL